MAGLTVAAVAVPQAMAYAQIANIPPQYGLYTAIVMTAVGALLDSSKQLINGPTNAISIAVLSALVGFSDAERLPAVFLLALMVGVIQTAISLLRLGDLTKYVSHSVIVGFTLGASVLLVLDQLKNLLGIPAVGTGADHFLKRFWLTIQHVDQTNMPSLYIGLGTVAIALGLRWVNGRMGLRLPELLLGLICTTIVVANWRLDCAGRQDHQRYSGAVAIVRLAAGGLESSACAGEQRAGDRDAGSARSDFDGEGDCGPHAAEA